MSKILNIIRDGLHVQAISYYIGLQFTVYSLQFTVYGSVYDSVYDSQLKKSKLI